MQAESLNGILIVLARAAALGFATSFFNLVILVLIRASTREQCGMP